MSAHFDTLETRPHAEREAALMAALPQHIAHAQQHSAAYAGLLSEVDAASINSRKALARLPVVRKHVLLDRQQAGRAATALPRDPFGGFATVGGKDCSAVRAPNACTNRPVSYTHLTLPTILRV